jgi:sugar (pentulose or hexulose) kinase
MQMIASITGIPIKRLNCADVCAMGAAMIAACGAGFYRDYAEAAHNMVAVEKTYLPIEEESTYYQEKFQKFRDLWSHLSGYYKGE